MVSANDYTLQSTLTIDECLIEIVILWQKFLVDLYNISCLPDIQGWFLPSAALTPHTSQCKCK